MKKNKKSFKQMLIYQGGDEAFTAYLTARDSRGLPWELRGYGETPERAAANVMYYFSNYDEKEWSKIGKPI